MSKPSTTFSERLFGGLTLCLTLLLSPQFDAQALPDDREQPISISADSASRDELAGETQYEGNVVLIQGSLEIKADTITIYHQSESADLIVAKGKPATMKQTPKLNEAPLNASANKIEYIRSEDRVKLTDSARVEQDGAIVTGDLINYLVVEQKLNAGSLTEDSGRVEVTIPPEAMRSDS